MDKCIRPGGYLYLDMRNWDRILAERRRFYLYNPFFSGTMRINLVQVWDYHLDGTMTFNLLYTFEENNRITGHETFEEHYCPISQAAVLSKLQDLGYASPEIRPYPAASEDRNPPWYCLIAKKPQ